MIHISLVELLFISLLFGIDDLINCKYIHYFIVNIILI